MVHHAQLKLLRSAELIPINPASPVEQHSGTHLYTLKGV